MQVPLRPYLLVAAVAATCLPVGCGKPDRTPDATSNPDAQVTTGGPGAAAPAPAAGTPPAPSAPPPFLGIGALLEALPGAFGKPIDGPEVAAVRRAVRGEPKLARSDDGRLTIYWWDAGLSLEFGPDRTLESAKFGGGRNMWGVVLDEKPKPYTGDLPYGLTWEDGPGAVERKLGKPDPTADEWTAGYKALGLKLRFVRRANGAGTQLDEVTLAKPGASGGRVGSAAPAGRAPDPPPPAKDGGDFPFSLADVRAELGPPTEGDDDFVDYRDRLNVRLSPSLGHLEVQAMTTRGGAELTAKFFGSKLFKGDEGKAALDLVRAKGGERAVGRFVITAKESVVVNGVVLLTLTPRHEK